MIGLQQQQLISRILGIGLFFVTVIVMTGSTTDPVNVPKLLILGVVSSVALGVIFSFNLKAFKLGDLSLKIALGIFLLSAILAISQSNSPVTQNIYGVYGRNNGFLTYLFLSIILFVSMLIPDRSSQFKILKSLIFAGFVNLAYCLWVIVFGDFIPWNNPYGNILGTFGNPNFIGAFLGILFGVLIAVGLGADASRNFRLALIFLLPLTLFEIVDSSAIQGRVLAALSFGIVIIIYLYFNVSRKLAYLSTFVSLILGSFALAGAFQKGPLTELIYKTSVSLRGQYWLSAWNTGQDNPISGVGLDAFGDWYRRSRDARAIELPGVNTVVNTAHNVPLDMFAFGGWPLFLSYLLIVIISFKAVVVILIRMKNYDAVGVGLITAWICYQVQSLISINQIGLAIWGWVLSGSLVAYSKFSPGSNDRYQGSDLPKKQKKNGSNNLRPTSVVYASIFGLVGFLISLPPFAADAKLRSAQVARDAIKLENSLEPGIFNPRNTQKYVLSIEIFESSGLYDYSHKYALEAVKWNPEAYDLWKLLSLIKNSTDSEKRLAIQNMNRLDPLNPDVTAL